MGPEGALTGFLISIASGVVLGVAVLLIIYKMIDGDLPVVAGLFAGFMILLAMAISIRSTEPAVAGTVLVISLSLMAFFPFAEKTLEDFALRGIDSERLSRAYEAVSVRPDNFAAKFELAHLLHKHGFVTQAVHLSGSTIASLSTERDEIRNRSMREVFHREETLLKRWQTEPQSGDAVKCPSCGAYNRPTDIVCTSCQQPHLLHIVRGVQIKPKVWAKLVLSWGAIALFIPLTVMIGMNLDGIARIAAFAGGLALVGGLLAWLFKPPKHASAIWTG
jgi:hypothetical protein